MPRHSKAIGPAMVAIYLPREIRGKALGILATVISGGNQQPDHGGFLTQYRRAGTGSSSSTSRSGSVPSSWAYDASPLTGCSKERAVRLPGAIIFFFALAALLWPVDEGLTLGWTSPAILGRLRHIGHTVGSLHSPGDPLPGPALRLRPVPEHHFLAASLAAAAMMLTFAGVQYLLPFFFEGVMGFEASVAGLLLAIPSVALMILGPISGALSDRIGSRVLATGAAAFACVTFFMISLFTQHTSILFIAVTLLCVGIATGIFFPPNMNQILGQSKKDEEGVGSSIMTTMKNVGETLGIALMGTIALFTVVNSEGYRSKDPGGADPDGNYRDGLCGRIYRGGRDLGRRGDPLGDCKGCSPVKKVQSLKNGFFMGSRNGERGVVSPVFHKFIML